ncbi:SRPBCC domain-containing protein [Yimella sp. cx-51]|uniref:SRPBCC family protein n=1 Tax=Yimella sp. cx-51 TaxID=2770551 RepID=UPI00165E7C9B|nr:SRPBCC family protein [Yimella sp. cx-51]MBC9958069.1 SRPBCC family protein [Yimella sp. cx-51]QTH38183.1 SRPBCC family protein [Yimella sp. cx-51]
MSKFSEVAATSQTLSLAAMEEASRYGQREADIDHLLLALTLDEGAAGKVLRRNGITLGHAREAVEQQHSAQLAALGITTPMPDPGPIVFHETGGYDWSERAKNLFTRSVEGEKRGDSAAVLSELLAEPSGLIEELLRRLGRTPEELRSELADVRPSSAHEPAPKASEAGPSRRGETFVPAPVHQVWQLLIDPRRMPEWEPTVSAVEYDGKVDTPMPGASWAAESHNKGQGSEPVKGEAKWFHQIVELTERHDERLIAWRFTYRDAPQANPRDLRIELKPEDGGTRLTISLATPRRRTTMLGRATKPLSRFMLGMRVSQIGNEISRAFR